MNSSETATQSSDRKRLPHSFDALKMKEEVLALNLKPYIYYDVLPLRSPAHLVDTSLPFPPPAEDYADGSWTDWLNTPELNASPYLTSIVDKYSEHTKVTLVRLLRLASGSEVKEHTDPTLALEVDRSVIRLTIPIITNDEVEFFLNETVVPMQPGECWYLRLSDPHKINNHGTSERINFSIDMIPNKWVRELINSGE